MRRLLLIALPLLMATVLWAVLSVPEPVPAATRTAPAADATVPDAAVAPPVDAASSRSSSEGVPDVPPVPADAIQVTMLVVDAAQPVADAEVAWMDAATWERFASLPPDVSRAEHEDQERLARSHGRRSRTDQSGSVRVNLGASNTTVFARHGHRYGSVSCDGNTEPPAGGYRIELHDDRTLLVQVLDSSGASAAGVPMGIARHQPDGTFLRWWNDGHLPATGADGTTRLCHLQQQRWDDGIDPLDSGAHWRVRTQIPGLQDSGVPFDPAAPPKDPLVLRLPALGSVEVRVSLRGQPIVPRSGAVNVTGLGNDEVNSGWQTRPDGEGRLRFPWLPLESSLACIAWLHGSGRLRQEFAGPTAGNRHVLLEMPVPDEFLVLTGRCVDDQGRALRSIGMLVEFQGTIGSGGISLSTDGEGRFQWFAGRGRPPLRLEQASFRWLQNGVALVARLSAKELTPGLNDLGDLRLTAGPMVVAGRCVVNGKGSNKPVYLRVERWQPDSREEGDPWRGVEGLTTSYLTEGRFEVHGETTAVRHRLCFPAMDHLAVAPIEFRPGAQDLEIEIVHGGNLMATVLLPRNTPRGIEAELRPEGEPWPVADPPERRRYQSAIEPWNADGERQRVNWGALPPGSYTLAFLVCGLKEELFAVTSVKVPAPAGGDPRLREVDLRERVEVLTVRIRDAEGKQFQGAGAKAFVQPQDPAATWAGHRFDQGELRMPAPARPIDLLIVGTGLPPKLVTGARGEVEVRLDPWPELTIVVAGLAEVPAGIALRAFVYRIDPLPAGHYQVQGGAGGRGEWFRAPTAAVPLLQGRAALPISEGRHRLMLQLVQGERRANLKSVFPNEVVQGSVPLEIRVSDDEVRQVIAQLQAPPAGK